MKKCKKPSMRECKNKGKNDGIVEFDIGKKQYHKFLKHNA